MCKSLTVTVSGESPWFITLVIGFVPDSLLASQILFLGDLTNQNLDLIIKFHQLDVLDRHRNLELCCGFFRFDGFTCRPILSQGINRPSQS